MIQTLGIIMDGNRRYARERGLPVIEGHRAGFEKLKEVVSWVHESGIPNLVVYGFSTENWNRDEREVAYLIELLRTGLEAEGKRIAERGGRVRFIGDRARFPEDVQTLMARVEADTAQGTNTLYLALSYGGRAEILDTVNRLVASGNQVSEEEFSRALWTADMPDPDLIIRTSGEQRLSGFLPWQGVYAELFFVKSYWPAFSKEELDEVIREYGARERRYGA